MNGPKKYEDRFFKSRQNIPKPCFFRSINTHKDWNKDIKESLIYIKQKKCNIKDIVILLNLFRIKYSAKRQAPYNKKQPEKYSFQALIKLYSKDIIALLSKISLFILMWTHNDIPIFNASINQEKKFKKEEIFYVICCMFMCLIPSQDSDASEYQRKKFNFMTHFSEVLSTHQFKTQCIVEYLYEEIDAMIAGKSVQSLYIIRKSCEASVKELILRKGFTRMRKFALAIDSNIQDHYDKMKISFANKFIGGGSLRHGMVQEEIMFATHPQLYASIILCQCLNNNEALCFKGFKRYFLSDGYRQNVTFSGRNPHNYKQSLSYGTNQCIVSIDAINFEQNPYKQYEVEFIDRQIIKAYTGFTCDDKYREVASGNWGCGVFAGDPQLKLIIQWIAASLAEKQMTYCIFGNKLDAKMIQPLRQLKIEEVYDVMIKACRTMKKYQYKYRFFDCLFI